MYKVKTVKTGMVVLMLLSLAVGCQQTVTTVIPDELTSSEYKVLLNPDKFVDREAAYHEYWGVFKKVAADNGVSIVENDDKDEIEFEQVTFFDTPYQDLLKHGYVLRVKYSYDDEGNRKSSVTYSLKARSEDRKKVLNADPRIAADKDNKGSKLELESDIVYNVGEDHHRVTFYSSQSKIKIEHDMGNRYGDYAELFPVLATFGVDADTPVESVGGLIVSAYNFEPGSIDFGEGVKCDVEIAVWTVEVDDSLWVVPELSYSQSFEKGIKPPEKPMELNVKFLDLLREAAPEWIVPGKTKSSFLFEYDAKLRGNANVDK